MATLDWKVGMRVVNINGKSAHFGVRGTVVDVSPLKVSIKRDDGVRGSGEYGAWTASTFSKDWGELVEPSVVSSESWSYGEADRLYENAVAAITAYNEYIERKPTTAYGTAYTPTKYE